MPFDTVCRTIRQYNSEPVPRDDMKKLQEIAEDYCKVKNYVYSRYGGISALSKLYPGYTVQNEMTKSGLRDSLNMPSVYFYLAVFDALGDIKAQWTRTKSKLLELVGQNQGLTPEEKHYLRFLLKVNNAFEAVVNQKEFELPGGIQKKYDELVSCVDQKKLHRYVCRQVRKYHTRQHTEKSSGFSASPKAYRYGEHGIYLAVKEKRKRVFIPLTDNNQYSSQIHVRLYPEKEDIEINVPISVLVKKHEDYTNQTGIAMGLYTMLTTDQGNRYGEELGRYHTEYVQWIRRQAQSYRKNREQNPGRKKYNAQKQRFTEKMHSYINRELNRFLQTEKPGTIYMVKLPAPKGGGINRRINHAVSMWQRGYIRSRLNQKCREQSVEVAEVLGKNISSQCSFCKAAGSRQDGMFICPKCGCRIEEKTNTAKNILRRGMEGNIVRYTCEPNDLQHSSHLSINTPNHLANKYAREYNSPGNTPGQQN